MSKKANKPVITVSSYYEGNAAVEDVFGKVYAQIIRDRKSAPLQFRADESTLKSS